MTQDKKMLRRRKQQYQYVARNRQVLNEKSLKRIRENLATWASFFPLIIHCQVCGKEIYFGSCKRSHVICFDHRHEGQENIKGSPTAWLSNHHRNAKNEEIWKQNAFGYLCLRCNSCLPTKNRKAFLEAASAYLSETSD